MDAKEETEFAQNLFANFSNMFISPEVERRKALGVLPDSFRIEKALVLISLDKATVVQINDEVEVKALARVKSGIEKERGSPIFIEEIESIESIVLPDQYKNSAYIFVLALSDGYNVLFDFLYNKSIRKEYLKRACDFLDAAEDSLAKSRSSVFIDTMYSATELAARMYLLQLPDRDFTQKSTHKSIQIRLNAHSRSNPELARIKDLLNKLTVLRHSARYGNSSLELDFEECEKMLATMTRFLQKIRKDFA